jgi:trans-2-enoyl-CoA reductase
MLYSSINHADLNMVEGTYGNLPKLPCFGGNEGVGVIEKVGEDVKNLKVNDNVIMAKQGLGTWRNYLVGDENSFYLLPNSGFYFI